MGEQYNQEKVRTFEVGYSIAFRIDRTVTDMHQLPCHVIDKQGIKYLIVSTSVWQQCATVLVSLSDLELHPVLLNHYLDWMGMLTISIHEASKTDTWVNAAIVRKILCERVALVDNLTNHKHTVHLGRSCSNSEGDDKNLA